MQPTCKKKNKVSNLKKSYGLGSARNDDAVGKKQKEISV
jgi:hypothetical protein